MLVRMAARFVGDEATAEDIVQDVFLRMHKNAPRLHREGSLLAYARAAVRNRCRMVLRRRRVAWRHSEPHPPPALSAEAAVMAREDRREVVAALARLPRRQREALVLRYYFDLTDDEASKVMGIRLGSVRSTRARALAALTRELKAR